MRDHAFLVVAGHEDRNGRELLVGDCRARPAALHGAVVTRAEKEERHLVCQHEPDQRHGQHEQRIYQVGCHAYLTASFTILLVRPPMVTDTVTASPGTTAAGTAKLIWYRPLQHGARPEYAAGEVITPTVKVGLRTGHASVSAGGGSPSLHGGAVLPRPVRYSRMVSFLAAGSE